jgi:hypothetical protein
MLSGEPHSKAKGGLSCERPPFVRFFEDLVRPPDHNVGALKSFATRERCPRFSSLFQYHSS